MEVTHNCHRTVSGAGQGPRHPVLQCPGQTLQPEPLLKVKHRAGVGGPRGWEGTGPTEKPRCPLKHKQKRDRKTALSSLLLLS